MRIASGKAVSVRWVVAAGAIMAVGAARASTPARCPSLDGIWLGSSICVAGSAPAACADERIRYVVRPDGGSPAARSLHAEKLAGGRFVPMGDARIVCDPDRRDWMWEVKTPSVHARWSFRLAGERLAGELRTLPGEVAIRHVSAERAR
jgi:hypothetical protein